MRQKRSYYAYVSLSICIIIWYKYIPQDTEPTDTTDILANQPVYNCCQPTSNVLHKNIFFSKIHKTGSSTIQNILLRFAERHSLDIMFVKQDLQIFPPSLLSLWLTTITPTNKYHILTDHIRYHASLKSYQYPDTQTVTILRQPAHVSLSLYEYLNYQSFFHKTFGEFIHDPASPIWDPRYWKFGYNQMSHDLGFDLAQKDNQTAIEEFVRWIDVEFDFVMITEYMDESLVLLANLMGWPLEYVVNVKHNARPFKQDGYVLTRNDAVLLSQLNNVDATLYGHFLRKFHNCVRRYGIEKLASRVSQLRLLNHQLEEQCVAGKERNGYHSSISYVPKNRYNWICDRSLKLEHDYTAILQQKQFERIYLKKKTSK